MDTKQSKHEEKKKTDELARIGFRILYNRFHGKYSPGKIRKQEMKRMKQYQQQQQLKLNQIKNYDDTPCLSVERTRETLAQLNLCESLKVMTAAEPVDRSLEF